MDGWIAPLNRERGIVFTGSIPKYIRSGSVSGSVSSSSVYPKRTRSTYGMQKEPKEQKEEEEEMLSKLQRNTE
jgi:hypothetical protein